MKLKKTLKKTLVPVVLLVGLIAMTFPANAETYRAAIWTPETAPHGQYCVGLTEKINNATDGRINFEIYGGGTLLPAKGVLPGLRERVADLALLTTAYIPSDFPYDNVIMDLCWLADDQLVDTLAANEMKLTHPMLLEEQERHNLVFNAQQTMGVYNYQCNTEIKTLDDLKGKKVRTSGAAHVAWATETGSISVAVPASEIYTGLQRGSIDCAYGTPLFMTDFFKTIDVVKAVNRLPLGSTNTGGYYFNRDFWKSLSAEDRRLILDLSAERLAEIMIFWNKRIDETWKEARERGVAIIEPSDEMMAKLNAYNENYKKNLAKTEMEKREIEDPTDLINAYLAGYAKWQKLLAGIDRNDLAQLTALIKSELYDKIDAGNYGM
jgi:TRAP-type C4-dicarboxylate transport system substrate-binding protein